MVCGIRMICLRLASRAAQTSTHQLKSAIQSSTQTCSSTFFSPLWNFPRSPFLTPLFSVLPPCTIAINSWHNWLSSEAPTGLFSGLTRMSSWDGFRHRSTEILGTAWESCSGLLLPSLVFWSQAGLPVVSRCSARMLSGLSTAQRGELE